MSNPTTPTPSKRLVMTSVNQLISLAQNNPQLSAVIPRFSQLQQASPSEAPKKSCNCGSKQNFTTPDANKQLAENILSSLTQDDFTKIKNVLSLDQLCYYNRDTTTNKLELICM
jgi:hypothetical protein